MRYGDWCYVEDGGCGRKQIIFNGHDPKTKISTHKCMNCGRVITHDTSKPKISRYKRV